MGQYASEVSAMRLWFILSLVPVVFGSDADYADQDSWSGECTTGKKQSPIHIHTKIRPSKSLRPIKFQNYDTAYSGTVSTGVSLSLTNQASGLPRVWGGAEKKNRFRFVNCHIHWGTSKYSGSEHRIGDERYAGEIHIVHYNEEISMRPWPRGRRTPSSSSDSSLRSRVQTILLGSSSLLQLRQLAQVAQVV